MVAVRMTMSMSWSFSGPFMPLFLIQLGVHPIAHVEIWAGAITSSSFLIAALVSPFWGSFADRYGRKRMVIRSCAAASVAAALMGLCNQPWQLLAVTALSGVFGGFSVASMTLVATQAPEESLGFALGWLSTGQIVGILIGPLIGGVLADQLHDFRLIFFVTAAGTLLATVGAAAFVQENFRREVERGRSRTPMWQQFREIARHPAIVPLLIVLLLAQLTAQAPRPIIPLFISALVGPSPFLATFAGAAIAVTGIADLIASPWLGKRSDRIGYRRVLIISLIGAAAFTLPQAFARDIWVFIVLRFGLGVFLGGILPAANALIGRLFPREQRGQVYGLTSSATFLGMFCGPMAGGLIAARFGFGAVFIVMGLLTLVNLGCVALSTRAAAVAAAA